jgi:hypothetical protein
MRLPTIGVFVVFCSMPCIFWLAMVFPMLSNEWQAMLFYRIVERAWPR